MDRLSQVFLRILLVSLLIAPLLLAACGASETPGLPSPQPTATPGQSPGETPDESPVETPDVTPGSTPSDAPAETPTTTAEPSPTPEPSGQRVEGGTLGAIWNLTALRTGKHPDRFRLVLEMEEARTTVPYYTATLTDEATEPFPGERDPAWGSVRIDLVVSDLYAYDYPLGDRLPIEVEDDPVATAVTMLPLFDDALLGFSIWLASPAAFEVHELTDPVRLVVDVPHP